VTVYRAVCNPDDGVWVMTAPTEAGEEYVDSTTKYAADEAAAVGEWMKDVARERREVVNYFGTTHGGYDVKVYLSTEDY